MGVGVTDASFGAAVQSELSKVIRASSFLLLAPSAQPEEPEGEEAGNLVETVGGGIVVGMERLAHAGDEMSASKRLLEPR
jgi:hypothetical protein